MYHKRLIQSLAGFMYLVVFVMLIVGVALAAPISSNTISTSEIHNPSSVELDNKIALNSERPPVLVVTEPSSHEAISRLESGDLDIYAYNINNPELAYLVEDSPHLKSYHSFGSYNELSFNPSGPVFTGTGKLNPFAIPRIRQAMNWLIDRDHIAREIMGGLGVPRYFPLNNASADYVLLAEMAPELEIEYGYNKNLAQEVISQEMTALGAYLQEGVWYYDGEPVEIIVLIRTEDERRDIGDYVATQLDEIGFNTVRDYKTSGEASPIWLFSDPADGLFHIYTGGWISTAISRDQASNFDFFYTPRGFGAPLWQAYTPSPEFDEISMRLNTRDYASLDERSNLMLSALELAMEDSVRVWLIDRTSITARRAEVSYASDLYGSFTSWLWPYTLQREGIDNTPFSIGSPSILTNPWNPLDGSNWFYDAMFIRATNEAATLPNPYTGLVLPQRIEHAEVIAQQGLVMRKTLDWVDLSYSPQIQVPSDAWVDWDAVEQRFITAGELYPGGRTAMLKSTVYYEEDLYDKVVWHDGSPFSLADVVMGMILQFDRAKEASVIFDPSKVGPFSSFMAAFRGVRILSEDPLIIETWTDMWQLDAELTISTWWPGFIGGTGYSRAQGAWHNTTLGIMAESKGLAAFSSAKADEMEAPWLNYISGLTLPILANQLAEAQNTGFFPYGPTLVAYLTTNEIQTRWQNLNTWYSNRDHFWLGTGPYYLEYASVNDKEISLKAHPAFPDPVDRWHSLTENPQAEVLVLGPRSLVSGEPATFEIRVTLQGEPYPLSDIEKIHYMLFDGDGNLAFSGEPEPFGDGVWKVEFDADEIEHFPLGLTRFEISVISNQVVLPTFNSHPFYIFSDEPEEFFLPILLRRGK
jgi:peptide/nickel transport system substrate-binding protein